MTGDVNPMHTDPRQVVASDWPADGTADEKLLFLLNYAVLAPSILNAQPWHFSVGDGVVELSEDRGRRLKVVDPEGREAAISCGAALFNLCVAARSFGLAPDVELLGEAAAPAVARVRLGQQSKPASAEDRQLRDAIPERRTSREDFEERKVPREVLGRLEHAAAAEGARFAWTDAVGRRKEIAALVAEAERAMRVCEKPIIAWALWLAARQSTLVAPTKSPWRLPRWGAPSPPKNLRRRVCKRWWLPHRWWHSSRPTATRRPIGSGLGSRSSAFCSPRRRKACPCRFSMPPPS